MNGIPPTLLSSLREVLRKCFEVFSNQQALSAVFIDERLKPWQYTLPEANNPGQRIDFTITYLARTNNRQGENLLVLLLKVLAEKYETEFEGASDLPQQLTTLAEQLEWLNQLHTAKPKPEATKLEANPMAIQMLPIVEVENMLRSARSVARVNLGRYRQGRSTGSTTGTGWLIAPGLAMTCWHVLEAREKTDDSTPIDPADVQKQLASMLLTFDYTVAGRGLQYRVEHLIYPTIETRTLDYALLRLQDRSDEPIAKRGYLRLDIDAPLTTQLSLYIIQHPLGQPQQMAGGSFERLSSLPGRILYRTPTEPGTSGAPAFNRLNWRVVALHNGENELARLREGTLLKPILSELEQHKPDIYSEIMAAQNELKTSGG